MTGRACVRNVVEHTVSHRGSPRPGDNPKPKGRSGKTKEEDKIAEARKGRSSSCEMPPRVRDGQTSPSMDVKPDTPPTARHSESWNVMPAVCP